MMHLQFPEARLREGEAPAEPRFSNAIRLGWNLALPFIPHAITRLLGTALPGYCVPSARLADTIRVWRHEMHWARALIITGGAAVMAAGCGDTAPPLRPEAFIARPGADSGIVTSQTDRNGTIVYGQLHTPILPQEYNELRPLPPQPRQTSLVPQQVTSTQSSAPATEPASMPATEPVAPGTPTNYQVVGSVIAIVNGTPLYADKILASLDKQLAADARRMTPQEFQQSAEYKIEERVEASIRDQQYLAAANEFLGADSKTLADRVAGFWRDQQVQAVGGSLPQAQEKAFRETGLTLDELTQNYRDQKLVEIFLQQRIYPLIQVTASDQREYYEQHIKDFTQTAEAKFRIIKFDVALHGEEEVASRIRKVADALRTKQPFDEISRLYNDDRNNGIVAGGNWVQKGSYINEKVEDAVWKLSPGEFTDPPVRVPEHNANYIAVLDQKKDGKVQPFEDVFVQRQIEDTLRNRQFQALRERFTQTLINQAVAHRMPGWKNKIMDMAMQRYYMWNTPKS